MLMRHGIRPPTKAEVTPAGVAAEAWPAWTVPFGHLTAHGYQAVKLLGGYDRAAFARDGVLPATGCPTARDIMVYSDADERTIRTGDALLDGLASGCGLANTHNPEGASDALFSPLDGPAAMDGAAARAAVLASIGSVERVQRAHRDDFNALSRVVGCCSVQQCALAKRASPCALADWPSELSATEGRPKLTGPMDFGPTAAQTLMLEYVEGMPMSQVGWGRATRADIERIMGLHAMKGEVLQRPRYVATRGAGPLLSRMLGALTDSGDVHRLTVLVGHDTNISDLSGAVGFTWQVASYPANTPPPGGAVGFMVVRDGRGTQFVRAFYRAQTMDQMRNLDTLTLARPAFTQWLSIEGCGRATDAMSCRLDAFVSLMKTRMPQ